eukprot:g3402.t1
MHTLTGNKGLKTAHSKYAKFRRKWNAPSDSSGSSSEEDMYRGYQPHVNSSIAQSTPKANSSTLRIMRREASVPRIKPQKQVSSAELIRRARHHDLSARSMAQSHSPSAIATSFKDGQDTRMRRMLEREFQPKARRDTHSPVVGSKRARSLAASSSNGAAFLEAWRKKPSLNNYWNRIQRKETQTQSKAVKTLRSEVPWASRPAARQFVSPNSALAANPGPMSGMNHLTVPLPGGISNMGNSCYMNATLQALSFLKCFVTDINCDLWQRAWKSRESAAQDTTTHAARGIFGHLAKVLKILHMRNASPEMSLIRQLKSAFVSVRPDFDNFFQQDAHEFLCQLVDAVHDELLPLRQSAAALQVESGDKSLEQRHHESSSPSSTEGSTPQTNPSRHCSGPQTPAKMMDSITLLPTTRSFHAEVKTTLRCDGCGAKRSSREMFRNCSLDVPQTSNLSLQFLVEKYFETEQLTANCDAKAPCGCKTATASKSLDVVPQILVLHLKRFRYDPVTNSLQKQSTPVHIPAELDLSAYLSSDAFSSPSKPLRCNTSSSSANASSPGSAASAAPPLLLGRHTAARTSERKCKASFKLVSIVRHIGSGAITGHYVACGENEGRWRRFDDASIQSVSAANAMQDSGNDTVYVLFYRRDEGAY